jgi:hypothetical protein
LFAKAPRWVKNLAEAFGFRASRVKGSHHILVHPDVREFVNLQEVGGKAKPLMELVEKYNLELRRDEERLSYQHLL